MQQPIDLSLLKDVKMPFEPSLFPLATGWWIVFIVFALVCLLGSILAMRSYFSAKSYALRHLNAIKEAGLSDTEFAREASKLLKRVALLKFGSAAVAKLSDKKWGQFLLKHTDGTDLTEQQANFIAFSAYLPEDTQEKITATELYPVVRRTLIHLFQRK